MYGSDQAASLEPDGLKFLIRYVRSVEKALGNGKKTILEEEQLSEKISSINIVNEVWDNAGQTSPKI